MFGYIRSKNNIIYETKGIVKIYKKYKFKKEVKSNINRFLNNKNLTYYDLYDFIQYIKEYESISLVDNTDIVYCIIIYKNDNVSLYDRIIFDRIGNDSKQSIDIMIDKLNTLDITWRYDNTRVSFIIPPSNGFLKEYEDVSYFVKTIMVKILLFKEDIHIRGLKI